MKSIILLILFSLLCSRSFAQTIGEDSIRLNYEKRTSFDQYPSLNERKIFDEDIPLKDKPYLNKFDTHYSLGSDRVNMDIRVPKFYQGPSDPYLSTSPTPFTNDYKYYNNIGLSGRSSISTSSIHETYLTVGALTRIRAMYNYSFNENVTISGGSYIAKYQLGMQIYNDAGVNASLRYKINDRITLTGFGQYSGFAKKHGLDAADRWDMVPTTNYGGAFEYKMTDNFGVMGGVSRQLNPMTGKWKNVPFFAPVFYQNK